jgi:hypothetical protein
MRITWDPAENRPYSSGVSQGVLYPEDSPGVAWNGLISVTEAGEQTQDARYFDGQRYDTRNREMPFAGTIVAYTYPDELEPYIGISGAFTGQPLRPFGFSYRTNNEIHIVYNALTVPPKRSYVTMGAKIDPADFEWNFTTQPIKIPGGKPSSHIVIMVDESQPEAITELEALIYGDDINDPSLPPVENILEIFESSTILRITDNGDGTWTADGPDSAITTVDSETFQINWPSVIVTETSEDIVRTWTFETSISGWSFWGDGSATGTVIRSTAWAHEGSYSALITVTGQGTAANEAVVSIPDLVAGDILTVHFTVHADAALANCAFGLDWKTKANTYISHYHALGVSLAAGETKTLSYTTAPAPNNAGAATLTFNMPPASPVGTAMAIDNVICTVKGRNVIYKISSL